MKEDSHLQPHTPHLTPHTSGTKRGTNCSSLTQILLISKSGKTEIGAWRGASIKTIRSLTLRERLKGSFIEKIFLHSENLNHIASICRYSNYFLAHYGGEISTPILQRFGKMKKLFGVLISTSTRTKNTFVFVFQILPFFRHLIKMSCMRLAAMNCCPTLITARARLVVVAGVRCDEDCFSLLATSRCRERESTWTSTQAAVTPCRSERAPT